MKFPQWWYDNMLRKLRSRHYAYARRKPIPAPRSWSQCHRKQYSKLLYRFYYKFVKRNKHAPLKDWDYSLSRQKQKIKAYHDPVRKWREKEFKTLKRLNGYAPPRRELPTLWSFAISQQVSKINRMQNHTSRKHHREKLDWSYVYHRALKRILNSDPAPISDWNLTIAYTKQYLSRKHRMEDWSDRISDQKWKLVRMHSR